MTNIFDCHRESIKIQKKKGGKTTTTTKGIDWQNIFV
jgi:hypothetical protein